MKKPGWFLRRRDCLFGLREHFLKAFVVDSLKKMFEKSSGEVTSGTTVIHCNTHTATHTQALTLADVLGSVSVTLLLYATV